MSVLDISSPIRLQLLGQLRRQHVDVPDGHLHLFASEPEELAVIALKVWDAAHAMVLLQQAGEGPERI